MRQKLLTKHCAMLLLALFATAWSTQAWAITINVNVTGNQAPYVYAWDNNQTPLIGAFPGTQLTNVKKVGNKTWYYIDIDASTANIILSFGTDATKTVDISVNGNRYFEFANNNANNVTDYYDLPEGTSYEANPFTYLVNTKNWNSVKAYVWGANGHNANFPGELMTFVGTNGNGNKVYKWTGATPANPTNVIFVNGDNENEKSGDLTWKNGAVWSNYAFDYQKAIAGAALNGSDFPDENLRKAISASLGVQEGQTFITDDVRVLDISYDTNKGMTGKITDPTGIEKFTALEELYARDNSLTHLDLTHTTTLRILDVSGNNVLQGMRGTSYCNATGHGVNVKGNNNFKKLIADDCSTWIYNAGLGSNNTNYQYISSLEYISQKNNPLDGWSSGFEAQTNLKYLDLTNTGQNVNHSTTSSRISVSGLTNLETLILANNTNLCSSTALDLTHNTNLIYLDLSNTGLNETRAKTTLNTVALSNLETLKVNKNPNMASAYTAKLPNLKHFEIADGDLYFTSAHQLSSLTPTNNPNLEYLDISNDQIYSSANPIDGFQNLKTVIANGNPHMPRLTINNCPAIESVDVSNNTTQTILSITNSALTTIPAIDFTNTPLLTKIDLSNNNFTAVPEINNQVITTMVLNNNQLTDIVAPSNIKYLYAQNNNFGSGDYTLPTTSLVGLDLGNNGFTKFKAENNTSLKSLALAGNTNLTEIELHGNTALTQTSPNGIIESDNGLYIKGLSSLLTLNIENSSFNKLGQQNSLEGVTGLKKLQARHNEFTTFTNGVYPVGVQGTGSYRIPDPDESSLEHLVALEYLDLAYNNLKDSVHLYKNVALKHLDVSHNNHITGVYDGTLAPDRDDPDTRAMLEKKARHLMKYGNVYQVVGTNPTDDDWREGYTEFQSQRSRPFDLRIEDLNDTIGLYHLDLGQNVNLEWLDFSYTNIHNTASKPEMMNTGWMDKDWVTDMGTWDARSSSNTTAKRAYTSWHTYVYFIPCSKLKVIHADHNNMQSLGIRYFPELDTLTCSYMYGDCAYMRDFSSNSALSSGTGAITDAEVLIGMGNISLSTNVQRLKSVTWSQTEGDNPSPVSTLTFEGPNGTSSYFTNPIKHYDVSYSGYNEVRFYPGNTSPDLPNLEHVNVSGNPLNCQVKHYNGATELDYSNVSNYNSLDVTYCPNIRTVLAENCSDLPIVRAHNRTKLDTLYLSNDPNLKTLYVQNDPVLKDNFVGLNTLTGLETLFGYNNTQWGNDISFSSNKALKNLWVSNIGARSINIANNANLEKLRAYDNSLTTLDLSHNGELQWLDVARNKLPNIDLSSNTKLQFFNISNGSDTRSQLNGTELLNHDGSDGDNIKPTTVFNADEAPIASADDGNSLSDLALPSSIIDARANGNDLHSITGSFANLTNIEFAHNHINGIDLSAASGATVESRDNGRTIVADFATFKVKDNNNQIQEYKVYFFQLENLEEPNGTILTDKESKDLKLASRHLGDDGLALDKISNWGSNNSGILTKSGTTVTPDNMGDILDPDQIPGKIVVLVPEDVNESTNEASGHATYTYTTGPGSEGSEFYLNWTSNGTVTGLNIVGMPLDNVSITNTYGNLTVAGADGTVVGVYDLNGRLVASETISGGTLTIDGLAPGIYVVNGVKVVVK